MARTRLRSDIEIVSATEGDREAVRTILERFFYPEEQLTTSYAYGSAVTQDDMDTSLSFIGNGSGGTVLLARLRNGDPGRIVGVAIAGQQHAETWPVTTRKFADIVAFLEQIATRAAIPQPCYHVHCLAVDSEFRGHSIGNALMERQMAEAVRQGYRRISIDCTGAGSVRLCRKLGMREVSTVRFDEYRDGQGVTVFGGAERVVVTFVQQLLSDGAN